MTDSVVTYLFHDRSPDGNRALQTFPGQEVSQTSYIKEFSST